MSRKTPEECARLAAMWNSRPWQADGLLPPAWWEANIGRFVHSPGHILASSWDYTPDWTFPAGYSGVYFLIEGDEIVYVGISLDVDARLEQHVSSGKQFSRVWGFSGLPEMTAKEIEMFYIYSLNPVLNSKKNPYLWPATQALIEKVRSGDLWPGWRIPVHPPKIVEPTA